MLSAEKFYHQRDSVTKEILGTANPLLQVPVRLEVSNDAITRYDGQLTLILLANMLARMCRRISLGVPEGVGLHPALHLPANELSAGIYCLMNQIDPFGEFGPESQPVYKIRVANGADYYDGLQTYGSGWNAAIGSAIDPLPLSDTPNPVGPAIAASVACADILKRALGLPEVLRANLYLSGRQLKRFEHPSQMFPDWWPARVVLGKVWFVGAGMVGSSLAYLLSQGPRLLADITLIDPDRVEYRNLSRSLLYLASHVNIEPQMSEYKTGIVKASLERAGATVRPVNEWFDAFCQSRRENSIVDLVLPLANERNVRYSLQHQLPPLSLESATAANWMVSVGHHVPIVDDCPACRFRDNDMGVGYTCGTGTVEGTNRSSASVALPFQAPLASALLLSEIVSLQDESYPKNRPNFIQFDARGNEVFSRQNQPLGACVCRGYDLVDYMAVNSESLFFRRVLDSAGV